MQSATVNLCNHNESQILGTTNNIIPSPLNYSLGGVLPQKSIIYVLKQWSLDNRCAVLITDSAHF